MAEPNTNQRPKPRDEMPTCPITGEPAIRRVQVLRTDLIEGIWRVGLRVDVSRMFKGLKRVDLFESPTGLLFFSPMIVGDGQYYDDLYKILDFHKTLNRLPEHRNEFKKVIEYAEPGMRVIDVGCGYGELGRFLPENVFVGLDPYVDEEAPAHIVREDLAEYAEAHQGEFDIACAFQVIEHVSDPLGHAREMVKLLKPGGLLILAAPLYPSLLTELPNWPVNLPPHHVTWWNDGAFSALAEALNLQTIEVGALPPSPYQDIVMWMRNFLIFRTPRPPKELYYAHKWTWHTNMLLAYLAGRVLEGRVRPPNRRPIDAYLVARK